MKIYIIVEHYENIIRMVCLSKKLAEVIVSSFSHLDLKIIEIESIGENYI